MSRAPGYPPPDPPQDLQAPPLPLPVQDKIEKKLLCVALLAPVRANQLLLSVGACRLLHDRKCPAVWSMWVCRCGRVLIACVPRHVHMFEKGGQVMGEQGRAIIARRQIMLRVRTSQQPWNSYLVQYGSWVLLALGMCL